MKLLIYGSQELGRVIKSLTIDCGYEFEGFIDDFSTGEEIVGTYQNILKKYSAEHFGIVIAIGYNNLVARWQVYQKVLADGFFVPKLIHPRSYISNQSWLGIGTIVMAGVVVDLEVKIEDLCVLWPGVIVNHDSIIGANTFLSPNATICGSVSVGHSCFVGAGAIIVDHRKVPDKTFIKAGFLYK